MLTYFIFPHFNSFRNTNRISNILNSDQDRHLISLDSGQDKQNVSPGLDFIFPHFNSFRNTNRISNILNSDQDRHLNSLDSGQDKQNVSPGLDPNCLQYWLIA